MNLPRNLKAGILGLLIVISVGAAGFMVFGDLTIGDAFYATMNTVSTLGFDEIGGPYSPMTRIWVSVVLVAGMFLMGVGK